MDEANSQLIPTASDPAEHSAAVAVDAIPHDLPHEAADLLETFGAIELDHADGHFIAAGFGDELAIIAAEIGFAGAGADAGILFHSLNEGLEIARRDVEVEIELADVIEVTWIDGFVAGVEGVDDAGADGAAAMVFAAGDFCVGELCRV